MNQKKNNMLIFHFVRIDHKLYDFDKLGKTLKIFKLKRHFNILFDSIDNLIYLQNNNTVHFHDLNGNLVKICTLIQH